MPVAALTSYTVVLALHIMAVISAYGLPLAYPMLLPYVRRRHPRAMPGLHDVQHRLNQRLTGPGTLLLFVFGAYMASTRHYWGEPWVIVGLGVLAAIVVVGGGVIVPSSRRMAELSRADLDAARPGGGSTGPDVDDAEIVWGAEYDRVYRRYMAAEVLLGVLVLVAIFFMAVKPFS